MHRMPLIGGTLIVALAASWTMMAPSPAMQEPAGRAGLHGPALLGVNIAGLEAGGTNGDLGRTHVVPTQADIELAYARGVRLFRLPIRATRVAQTVQGPLNKAEVAAIHVAARRVLGKPGTELLIDWHDFGRAWKIPYGQAPFDAPAIVRLNTAVLGDLINNPRVIIGIQNEPHLASDWWPVARSVVGEMRRQKITNWVSVSGSGYSAANQWARSQAQTIVSVYSDPLKRTYFEPHTYYDKGGAGQFGTCQPGAENRLAPAIQWAEQTDNPLIIGETAFGDDPACDNIRRAVIARIRRSPAVHGVTFWVLGNFYLYPRYSYGLTGPGKGRASVLFDKIVQAWNAS